MKPDSNRKTGPQQFWKGLTAALFLCAVLSLYGCRSRPTSNSSKSGTKAQPAMTNSYYTCPMHRQIQDHKPGKCPICGMALIRVKHDTAAHMDSPRQLVLSDRQQKLAGIQMDTAKQRFLARQRILTGTIICNPNEQNVISAPVNGWIKKLYVRNPGEKIHIGEKLYALYSPELLSAEKDYLLALQQKDLFEKAATSLSTGSSNPITSIGAMKQKLLRWGLSEQQIENLHKELPLGKVTVYSRTSGFLLQKNKAEGAHVDEGETILSLAGHDTLWVQAQLYDSELSLLSHNLQISVQVPGIGKRLPGRIAYDNPLNVKNERIHLLHIAIPNPGEKIQTGMLAYVYLQMGHGKTVLAIPRTAVIQTERNHYIWISLTNNTFERRKVQLGNHNETWVQVLQGVKPDEKVVSSGAFLLNSEYLLKYGGGPVLSGMQMSDMDIKGKG